MKRRIEVSDSNWIEKRARSNESETVAEWIMIPEELIPSILLFAISHFTGDIKEDPVLDLKLVCKGWHSIIRSSQFHQPMRDIPGVGRWIVTKSLAESIPVPIDALQAGRHMIDDKTRLDLLFNAHRIEILELISDLPGWKPDTLKFRKTAYQEIILNRVTMAVPFFDQLQLYWYLEEFIRELYSIFVSFNGSSFDCHVLFNMPQHELIKLMMIDDLALQVEGSFFQGYIADEVLRVYHDRKGERPRVTSWLAGFKNITLPISRKSILLNLFYFPMVLAILADARDFVQFIMGEQFQLPEYIFEAALFILNIQNQNIPEDDQDYLVLFDTLFTEEILQRENMVLMGFNKQAIRVSLERLASLVGPKAQVQIILRTEF